MGNKLWSFIERKQHDALYMHYGHYFLRGFNKLFNGKRNISLLLVNLSIYVPHNLLHINSDSLSFIEESHQQIYEHRITFANLN